MKLDFKELASRIALCEGRKHQASIGDVREILSLLMKMIKKNPIEILKVLLK